VLNCLLSRRGKTELTRQGLVQTGKRANGGVKTLCIHIHSRTISDRKGEILKQKWSHGGGGSLPLTCGLGGKGEPVLRNCKEQKKRS